MMHPSYGTPEDLEVRLDRSFGQYNGVANYGEYCSKFDRGIGKNCDGTTMPIPEWCRQSWCYIMPLPENQNVWMDGALDTNRTYRSQLVTYKKSGAEKPEFLNLQAYCTNARCTNADDCGFAGEGTFLSHAAGMINPLENGKLVYSYGMCKDVDSDNAQVPGGQLWLDITKYSKFPSSYALP